VSASRDLVAADGLRPVSTVPAARGRLLRPTFFTAASLLSLAGFALVAAALRAPYNVATALLGFAGYVFLLSKALRCLPVDWDVWTNRRKPALPPPLRGRILPFGSGSAAS
jgi:hypothetical protein